MKIAILILAHKNPGQLQQLIAILKPGFEVFVHYDERYPIPEFLAKDTKVHLTKKRYPAYWGSYNAQLAILELFKCAFEQNCDYHFLISGQDLPLMKSRDIISFVNKNYHDYLYAFPLPKKEWSQNGGLDRMELYWDTKYESGKPALKIPLLPYKAVFYALRKIQKTLGLRRKVEFPLYCGSLWMNLTREAVLYILSFLEKSPGYINRFKHTRCTDEIFFHTILLAFDYPQKGNIINDDMRFIDWQTGPTYPRVFTIADYERCIASNRPFGRKFDEETDGEIIRKITSYLLS